MWTFQVFWTDDAVSDLHNIIACIYNENQSNAKSVYLAIKEQCATLEHFPFRARIVPELEILGITQYRELIFKRWRIIYSIEKDTVYLLLIVDSRQDIQEQLVQRIISEEREQPSL